MFCPPPSLEKSSGCSNALLSDTESQQKATQQSDVRLHSLRVQVQPHR